MSRDIILPGGDTLKLFDSAYTASEVEAVLTKALRQPGRNLLINSYFVGGGSQQGGGQFPINDRGKTEYTGNGYCINNWFLAQGTAGKCVLTKNGISLTFTPNGLFGTAIESNYLLADKIVTFSFLTDDNQLLSFTNVFPSSGNKIFYFSYNGYNYRFWFQNKGTSYAFFIYSEFDGITKSIGLIAAKLELGPNQTLAHQDTDGNWVLNGPPQDFALELLKCQRHQYIFGDNFAGTQDMLLGYAQSTKRASFIVNFPVKMRAIPTFSAVNPNWSFEIARENKVIWLNEVGGVFSMSVVGRENAEIIVTTESDVFTVGEPLTLYTNVDTASGADTKRYVGQLIFDANL